MAEPLKLDIELSAANLSDFKRSIEQSVSSVNISGGTAKGGGKNKGILDAAILSEALSPLIDPLLDVAKGIVTLVGAALGAFFVLKVIGDVINAIFGGFKPLIKIWNLILGLISKMVEPFVRLFIPAFMFLVYPLTTLVKFLNITLKPLFAAMMKIFAGAGQGIGDLAGQLFAGEIGILEFIQGALEIYKDALIEASGELRNFFVPILKKIASVLIGFLTFTDWEGINETLNNLLGEQLGSAITFFLKIIHSAISALAGLVIGLVGTDVFDEMEGIKDLGYRTEQVGDQIFKVNTGMGGLSDQIKEVNDGFSAGVGIGETLRSIITILSDLALKVAESIIPQIEPWASALSSMVETILEIIAVYEENGAVAAIQYMIDKIKEIAVKTIKPIIDEMNKWIEENVIPNFKNALIDLTDSVNSWVTLMNAFNPVTYLKGLLDKISPAPSITKAAIGPAGGLFNDFISRPGQAPASFSSDDTIIGVKDPSSLGGKGNTTINVYGNGEREIGNLVRRIMEEEYRTKNLGGYMVR